MKTLDLIPITEQMTGGNKQLANALQKNFETLKQFMTHRELTITTSLDNIAKKLSKEMNEKFIAMRKELKEDMRTEVADLKKEMVDYFKKDFGKKLDDILKAVQKNSVKK